MRMPYDRLSGHSLRQEVLIQSTSPFRLNRVGRILLVVCKSIFVIHHYFALSPLARVRCDFALVWPPWHGHNTRKFSPHPPECLIRVHV